MPAQFKTLILPNIAARLSNPDTASFAHIASTTETSLYDSGNPQKILDSRP